MSDFASCYFCGDAVDADVRAYPVVPENADAPTVDLCPPCHRKLTSVLETVLTSVTDDAVAVQAVGAADDEGTDDDDPVAAVDGPDLDDGDDLLHDIGDPAGDDGAAEDGAGSVTADDAVREAAEGAESGDDPGEEADTADAGADTPAPGGDSQDSGGEPAGDDGGPVADSGVAPETGVDEATEPAESEAAARPGATDEGTAADPGADEESGRERGGGASAETASLLTTPTAKKVVKLLQNRAFPVDREEFEVVASNAYDIPMAECEDVIDALVAEGYVAADGGQLVRPE